MSTTSQSRSFHSFFEERKKQLRKKLKISSSPPDTETTPADNSSFTPAVSSYGEVQDFIDEK
jgi:hypothetical protein